MLKHKSWHNTSSPALQLYSPPGSCHCTTHAGQVQQTAKGQWLQTSHKGASITWNSNWKNIAFTSTLKKRQGEFSSPYPPRACSKGLHMRQEECVCPLTWCKYVSSPSSRKPSLIHGSHLMMKSCTFENKCILIYHLWSFWKVLSPFILDQCF